jgi:hypothetical protein
MMNHGLSISKFTDVHRQGHHARRIAKAIVRQSWNLILKLSGISTGIKKEISKTGYIWIPIHVPQIARLLSQIQALTNQRSQLQLIGKFRLQNSLLISSKHIPSAIP